MAKGFNLKRTVTGIAAAAMALGMMVPAAFAATTSTATAKYTVGTQKTITVNGSVASNPFQLVSSDGGIQTSYMGVYYFGQAIKAAGGSYTWDYATKTFDVEVPGVDAATVAAAIPGGVGTDNTTITVNGTKVKMVNSFAAQDPAGGKSDITTFMPIFYLGEVFGALGSNASWDNNTFAFKTFSVAPVVSSVTVPNLKQVVVNFSQPVDSTTATNVANYTIKNAAGTDFAPNATASLSADGKSVTLTLDTTVDGLTESASKLGTVKFANPDTVTVTVSGVKAASGSVVPDYTSSAMDVADTSVPTVTGVTQIGPNQVKVQFSEPVYEAGTLKANAGQLSTTDFVLDKGAYSVVAAKQGADYFSVVLTLGTDLTDGAHSIEVDPSGSANITDFAGYKLLDTTQSFTAATDTTVPTVTASASQTSVTLTFSKPVKNVHLGTLAATYDVAGYQMNPVADSSVSFVGSDGATYSTIWKVDYSATPLAPGSDALYLDNNSSSTNAIQDLWGNKVATKPSLSVWLMT